MALPYVVYMYAIFSDSLTSWRADIYFFQKNNAQRQAALELRDAVLRLRRDGAFVAVPLWRVNYEPMGPHPCGTSAARFLYRCHVNAPF